MIVEYKKRFLKELAKVPSVFRVRIEHFVFDEIPNLNSITESTRIEKMKGYSNFYKVRFGDYRVGLQIINKKVLVSRVLHRKEIYRYFP